MVQRLFYRSSLFGMVMIIVGSTYQVFAEISEPIPLSPQPIQQPLLNDPYPPATEAYNPGAEAQSLVPLETLQTHVTSPPLQEKPQSPLVSKVPLVNRQGYNAREELERVAAECKSEIERVWAYKTQLRGKQLAHFQKKVGDAKLKCDELNEVIQHFKEADEYMQSYQKSLQEAQNPLN